MENVNIESLKVLVEKLKKVDGENFTMSSYNGHNMIKYGNVEVQCVDKDYLIENRKNVFNLENWLCDYTNIEYGSGLHVFLFSTYWESYDNTLSGAIKRLDYIINGGVINQVLDYDKAMKLYNC